jgi:phosphohistidine phosphatase
MKTVFLVRHAKSSWGDPSLRDIQRPLNERGLSDAPLMGRVLFDEAGRPDVLVSSPAVRARTTAHIFAEIMGIPKEDVVVVQEIYEAYITDIIDIIENLDDDYQKVMLFGHNPTFTSVANMFESDIYIPNLPTCGIVKIVSDADTWEAFSDGNPRMVSTYFPRDFREGDDD